MTERRTFTVVISVREDALRNLINQGFLDATVDKNQCLTIGENRVKLNRLLSEIVNSRWGEK